MKQIAVLGLGRFGRSLARTLAELGHDVLGVDNNAAIVDEMAACLTNCVQADIKDEAALAALGLRNFDVVVVSIGGDAQACIIATMLLKEMGVQTVVCKVTNALNAKILSRLGADRIIFPERDMGVRLARSIANTDVLDFIELSQKYSMVEMNTPAMWAGKSILETDARAKYGVNIVAIHRGADIIVTLDPKEVLQAEDVLVLIGANADLDKLNNM